MKRVSYGKERTKQYPGPRCPHCSVRRGAFHEYGCLLEECPKCGDDIINCSCMVLFVEDDQKLIQSLKENIDHNVAFTLEDHSRRLDNCYMERAAKVWIDETFPPNIDLNLFTFNEEKK